MGYPTAAAAMAGAALLFAPKAAAVTSAPVVTPVEPAPVAPVVAAGAAAGAGAAALAAGGLAAGAGAVAPTPPAETVPVATTEIPVTHEEGGGFGWLKWLLLGLGLLGLLFLLLRFCGDRGVDVPAVVATDPLPVAMVTCWNGEEAETLDACPAELTCWDGTSVTALSACPVEPEPEVETVTCWDGSEVTDFADCPPLAEDVVEDPAVDAPVEVAEPVVSPTASGLTTAITNGTAQAIRGDLRYAETTGTCSCAASDANLFTTVGAQLPVIVTRLGTNPEFGNHQGQSSAAFFSTLQNRYMSDDYDRTYLDYLARSLGYGDFMEMDASMFTETTAQRGSRVMLGYGSQHALQYSQLDLVSDADLSAFRVRAANGCDVNFMKTCGNFMYVCD